jgi:hypothetical protein
MTNAERQKAWRKRHPYTSKRTAKERMRRLRHPVTNEAVRNEEPIVRNTLKRQPRPVPVTHYETDDEAWEREHAPRVPPPAQMEPAQTVVIPDVISQVDMGPTDAFAMTVEERRAAFDVLKATYSVTLGKPNMGGRAAPETSPQLLEIEME